MTAAAGEGRDPATVTRPPLSVLITARDEEAMLPAALASVSGWADQVTLVLDPRSRDRTRELAMAAGAAVHEHPFESSAAQCNWGLARCAHRWVLVLDADERVTPELRRGIDAVLSRAEHPAYAVRRRNLAFGRALRFGDWGGDRIVRLLDRERAAFVERAVHGAVRAESTGAVRGDLVHDTLRSLDQYLPKLADYAARGAADVGSRRVGALTLAGRPAWRFLRGYVLRLGFLDGLPGLVVAGLTAGGAFLKWARVWEEGETRRRQRP